MILHQIQTVRSAGDKLSECLGLVVCWLVSHLTDIDAHTALKDYLLMQCLRTCGIPLALN